MRDEALSDGAARWPGGALLWLDEAAAACRARFDQRLFE